MSDNPVDLRLLGVQVRALQRQLAMLQASQAQLPTLDQFQAGLTAIDTQIAGLADLIGERVTAAIGDHLTEIANRLTDIETRLK